MPLQDHITRAYRLARALTNNEKRAQWVVRFLIERHPATDDDDVLERYFNHHALMQIRQAKYRRGSEASSLQAQAFDAAIANLEPQQREAWFLDQGERYPIRRIGIAMDCSQTAALSHLGAARRMLETVAGPDYDAQCRRVIEAYHAAQPPVIAVQRGKVARKRRKLFRAVRRALILLIASVIFIGGVWQLATSGAIGLAWKFFNEAFNPPTTLPATSPSAEPSEPQKP